MDDIHLLLDTHWVGPTFRGPNQYLVEGVI